MERETTPQSGLPQVRSQALVPARRLRVPIEGEDSPLGISFDRYLKILLRRKWVFLAVVVTVVGLAALEVYTTTPLYQATARLQIDPEELNVLPYQDISDPGQMYTSFQYQMTQLEKLRSRELSRRVVERLELAGDRDFQVPAMPGAISLARSRLRRIPSTLLRFLGGAGDSGQATEEATDTAAPLVNALRARISAQPVGETRLIEVSYTSPVPALAARVANGLAEEFVRLHVEGRYRSTGRATEFLERELEELKGRVEGSQEELLQYARGKKIINLTERESLNRKKLADLTDQLTVVEAELNAARALVREVEEAGPGEQPDVLKDERIRELETQLGQLEGELAGLSSRYGPEWPTVKELQRKLEELRSQLAAGRSRALAAVRQSYSVIMSRYQSLLAAIEEQKSIVDQLDNDSIQYNILKREADTNQELYEGLLQRLKEAGIAAGLESSNIQVAERAVTPGYPAFPHKTKALSRALFMAILLGLGTVFLLEFLDKTVKTTDDIQQFTGLPSLGAVPALAAGSSGKSRRRRSAADGEAPRPILASQGLEFLRGGEWEAYRSLRAALLLSHSGQPPQAVLITSPGPGEGKTTTAANLAVALAQTGARTLMVDLDLRRPVLAKAFGLDDADGMSSYLSGNSDLSPLIKQTDVADLFIVPAGPPPPNPPELIGSTRLSEGLSLLREYFDYIVVDSPPVLALSDSYLLSSNVDGVILVARAGSTPKQALRRAGESFMRIGSSVIGVVLNGAEIAREHYGYYYGAYGDSYYSRSETDTTTEKQSA